MIKVNEYLEGNVKSLEAISEEGRFTNEIMPPGEYTFKTNQEEHITISLDKVHDELWDFGASDDDKARRIFGSFFSYSEDDFDNELSNAFKPAYRRQGGFRWVGTIAICDITPGR